MIFSHRVSKIFITLLVAVFCIIAHPSHQAHAQVPDDVSSYDTQVNEGDFDFEVNPENPQPFEDVDIKVDSSLVDTNRYLILWSVDGKEVKRGIGERRITVRMKDYNQIIRVTMSIKLIDSVVTKDFYFAPQDTTLTWEAVDSYVPPFYPGKKLPARESILRVIALPNFNASSTKNAVYIWKRNSSVVENAGGYGKDSILIKHNRIRAAENIEVETSNVSGDIRSTKNISIGFFEPKILFYQRNTTTGITSPFSKNIFSFAGKTTDLIAQPFFFSLINQQLNTLSFNWTMNDLPLKLPDPKKPHILTLENPGGKGNSSFGLNISNNQSSFQNAKAQFRIQYSD
jgi:hypothetical protein